MKRILLSLFAVSLFTINIFAQKNNHLTFKDIPITGKLAAFVEKMKNSGFTITRESDDDWVEMEGQFVNQQCEIYIAASSKSNTVWKVMVFLPKDKNWRSIKGDYFKYKDLFKQKYGSSSLKSFEFFTKPYYEGDGYEIQALSQEKCDYVSFWSFDNGGIIVKISKYAQIQFTYEDDVNASIAKKEQEEGALNDI